MERAFLLASTVFFFCGFAYSVYALRARLLRPSRWNFAVMLVGFILQSGFLHLRGQAVGKCPLSNLFEVLVFLSWAVVLLYFIVGGTYRLSLLGTFTAPLVFLLQTTALLHPSAALAPVYAPAKNFWAELHAAVALVAYGAFALGCVAAVMFLVQERLLKQHRLNSFFHRLPPIADLATAMRRVSLVGFCLLSVALAAGVAGRLDKSYVATALVSAFVWGPYGGLLVLWRSRRWSPRRLAWWTAGAFVLALLTLGAIDFLHIGR